MKATQIISVSLCASIGACKTSSKDTLKPNIILIVTDDVTLKHLSCYGGKIPTPNIERLADEGMIFSNAYCVSSVSTPSRYNIMTGQYPSRCIAPSFLKENPIDEIANIEWNTPIIPANYTIHELLNDAGYYTGFVGKFHIGELEFDNHEHNKNIPDIDPMLNPGSDRADSLLSIYQNKISEEVKRLTGTQYAASVLWENSDELPVKALRKHNLEWLTQGAVDFLESVDSQKPFFLHFNTTALHGPNHFDDLYADAQYTPQGRMKEPYKYHPERKTIFERLIKLGVDTSINSPHFQRHYDAGIIYMDDQIGVLLNKLDKLGLAENTLIIFTADHGIEPGKSVNYNMGTHVPFIVRWPAKIKAGSRSSTLVQFSDFMPTFAQISESNIPDSLICDGFSFMPVLMGEQGERSNVYHEMGYSRAISDGMYKLITTRYPQSLIDSLKNNKLKNITHFGNSVQAHALIASEYYPDYFEVNQFYNLQSDSFEQNNIIDFESNTKANQYFDVLEKIIKTGRHPYPLNDSTFGKYEGYANAVNATRKLGTASIPWWQRKLNFPPVKEE